MNRIARLLNRNPTLPRGATAPEAGSGQSEDPAPCCGWYDSSHELSAGLVVCEHQMDDPGGSAVLGALLPLKSWLELELAGWRERSSEPPLAS